MSEDTILILCNSRSGGQKGQVVLEEYRKYLDDEKLFDLSKGPPAEFLNSWVGRGGTKRVLACGGDGTVAWVLSVLDELNPPDGEFLVATMPLGTANDLSRTFQWGKEFSKNMLKPSFLDKVKGAKHCKLNRWLICVMPDASEEENYQGEYALPHGLTVRTFEHDYTFEESANNMLGNEDGAPKSELKSPNSYARLRDHSILQQGDYSGDLVKDMVEKIGVAEHGGELAPGRRPTGKGTAKKAQSFLTDDYELDESKIPPPTQDLEDIDASRVSTNSSFIIPPASESEAEDETRSGPWWRWMFKNCVDDDAASASSKVDRETSKNYNIQNGVISPKSTAPISSKGSASNMAEIGSSYQATLDGLDEEKGVDFDDFEEIKVEDNFDAVPEDIPDVNVQRPHFMSNSPALLTEDEHPKPMDKAVENLTKWMSFDGIFCNYFSIGLDASMAHAFHTARDLNPEKFNTPTKNKLMYVKYGATSGGIRCCSPPLPPPLDAYCKVEYKNKDDSEFKEFDMPRGYRMLAVLNLQSYAGGRNIWGTQKSKRFMKPSWSDGLIEVVGVKSPLKLGLTLGFDKAGAKAKRFLQCKELRIHVSESPSSLHKVALQVDGEPWLTKPCTIHIKVLPNDSAVLKNER